MKNQTMKYLLFLTALYHNIFFGQFTSIPDPGFENALISSGIDTILDGQVLTQNISGIQFLDVSDFGISNLAGIEDFTSLVYLDCYDNLLTSLDLSNCTNLEWLDCESNSLSSLDVSQNTMLQTLWCYENQLQSINVTGCINLQDFEFDNNLLTYVDLSTNVNLVHIDAWTNLLQSLDVSNCPNLQSLEVYGNNYLECLNLKNGSNNLLQELDVEDNLSLNCIEVDDSLYSLNNWVGNSDFTMDSSQYFSQNCNYSSNCFSTTTIDDKISRLSIFPNPTQHEVTVSVENYLGDLKTEVYDFTGKLLEANNSKTLSLLKYPKGIYLLKVSYGDRIEEVKVVKE